MYLHIFCSFNTILNSSDYSLRNIAGTYLVTPGIRRHKSLTLTLKSIWHVTHYLAVLVYRHDFYLLGLRFNYVSYWYCTWFRHCAKRRKVTGSNSDGVIGIFHWYNPSSRTMALGSTQPLTEGSTRDISWGVKGAVRRANNPATFMCRMSWNLGASNSWNLQGLSRSVMGLLCLFTDSVHSTVPVLLPTSVPCFHFSFSHLHLFLYKRVPTILVKVSSFLNNSEFMPCHLLPKGFIEASVANY